MKLRLERPSRRAESRRVGFRRDVTIVPVPDIPDHLVNLDGGSILGAVTSVHDGGDVAAAVEWTHDGRLS